MRAQEEPGDHEPGQEAHPLVPVVALAVGKTLAEMEVVPGNHGSPAVAAAGGEVGASAVSAVSEEHGDRIPDRVTCPAAALLENQEAHAVGAAEAAERVLAEVHQLLALLSNPGSAIPCR